MRATIYDLIVTVFFGLLVFGTIMLGQWVAVCGPEWMRAEDGVIGFGTFLAFLVAVVLEIGCWLISINISGRGE